MTKIITTNLAQISSIANDIIEFKKKRELTLMDLKILLGLRPWVTMEDVINEIKKLSE